ncbi:MAG TPA: tetratricopeptide repeat protein [Brevundimonas sp.]|nr:tetratricopeptide repeat protein [Brevundimonas sp.]
MMNRIVIAALLVALSPVSGLPATAQAPSPQAAPAPGGWQQEQAAAEAANDLPRAIAIVRGVTEVQPTLVPAWVQLGRLNRLAGNPAESIEAFGKALAIAPNNPRALLGSATVETQRGNLDRANELVGRAVAAGVLPGQLDALAELEPLRQTALYRTNYDIAVRGANPCRYQPESSQFDFWVGDWDVYVNGQVIARNIITKEMNGCIIHERYQTTNGLIRGESINYFDGLEQKWKQVWVSGTNNVIALSGTSPEPGVMSLDGTSTAAGSPIQLQRVTWTRDAEGGLTQSVSVSNDNGATWSAGFSGRYVRSNRSTPTLYPDDTYPANLAVAPAAAPASGGG